VNSVSFIEDFYRQIQAGSMVAVFAAIAFVVIGVYVALVLTRR
jgi:hypothetical protein